ncbi:LOW QUALITY PROTEIN: hypothetical protein NC651_031459 [Populus alba x Populus x berolinensis]|nr:LOW QUALITY PROTEIN: hypothetical protein NC651_031459 [Populus alba x Populus x berolinensis]
MAKLEDGCGLTILGPTHFFLTNPRRLCLLHSGDPFPLEVTRASKALRVQQLSEMAFPLGTIPSFSPTSTKDLGSFSLQSLFLKIATSNSWLGLIGQFRPKKLISSIKGEFY